MLTRLKQRILKRMTRKQTTYMIEQCKALEEYLTRMIIFEKRYPIDISVSYSNRNPKGVCVAVYATNTYLDNISVESNRLIAEHKNIWFTNGMIEIVENCLVYTDDIWNQSVMQYVVQHVDVFMPNLVK